MLPGAADGGGTAGAPAEPIGAEFAPMVMGGGFGTAGAVEPPVWLGALDPAIPTETETGAAALGARAPVSSAAQQVIDTANTTTLVYRM